MSEDKSGAEYALEQIGMLYKVETMADDQSMDYEVRTELRARLAYPIMCAFEKWIVNYMPKVLPQGRMSKALTHIAGEAGKNRQNSVHNPYFINNSE